MEIAMKHRAMLGSTTGPDHLDWNHTVADCVREFLRLSPEAQRTCFLDAMTPIRFDDELPPRRHLSSDMIERLANRMRAAGEL